MRKEGIESDILPDGSLDSGRGTRSFRFRRRQRAQPISAGTRGANATHHSRRLRSPYDHPRSHDRTAAAATARLRGRYRAGSQGLLRARRRGGDQCQPVAARSRLALAPKGAGTGLPDEHQPRRAFDVGAGPDPLGGRNGTQGLGAENARPELSESQGVLAISARPTDVSSPGSVGGYRTRRCAAAMRSAASSNAAAATQRGRGAVLPNPRRTTPPRHRRPGKPR